MWYFPSGLIDPWRPELSQSGQSPLSGPAGWGATGWVWQAGSPGQGCPLSGQAWGEGGGPRASGWLPAGAGRPEQRVFTPHPDSSQTLISELLCGPDPGLGAVGAQRQEVLPSRSFHPVGSISLAPHQPGSGNPEALCLCPFDWGPLFPGNEPQTCWLSPPSPLV